MPAAKSAAAAVADRHAFPRTLSFWKCGPEDDFRRRDAIVSYAFCNNIGALRRLNPRGIFLLTPGLFPRNGAAAYGGMHVTYGAGPVAWRTEECDKLPRSAGPVNLGCIRAFDFDSDFMWNVDGSIARIFNGTTGHGGWNLADPVGSGTREFVAKFFAYTAKVSGLYTDGWDGVFSDNWTYGAIGQSWAYGPNLDTDRDGRVDDYATLRKRWDDGLNEVGGRIRSYLPGKTLAGNGSWYPMWLGQYGAADPQGWLKASNATFVDDMQDFYRNGGGGPPGLLRIASRWLAFADPAGLPRYVLFRLKALTASGDLLSIPSGANPNDSRYMLDPGVMRSMRWGLTLALMSGAYFEIVANGRDDTVWWYDEFDGGKGVRSRGYLGEALGQPVKLRTGRVWRRDFKNGIALNNSTSKPVRIDLGARFKRLRGTQNPGVNNGKVVTRVTLPAHDGLILLKIRQK
jgi:hypothetical protein